MRGRPEFRNDATDHTLDTMRLTIRSRRLSVPPASPNWQVPQLWPVAPKDEKETSVRERLAQSRVAACDANRPASSSETLPAPEARGVSAGASPTPGDVLAPQSKVAEVEVAAVGGGEGVSAPPAADDSLLSA